MVKAQELIVKCLIEMVKNVYENSDKEELSFEFIEEQITLSLSSGSTKPSPKKKEKKQRERKEIPEEEQCKALKKDGGRCNGRKHSGGENPQLCSLHNNKGVNFGLVGESSRLITEMLESVEEEFSVEKTPKKTKVGKNKAKEEKEVCNYTFETGDREGQTCSNEVGDDKKFCKLHVE